VRGGGGITVATAMHDFSASSLNKDRNVVSSKLPKLSLPMFSHHRMLLIWN